MTPDRPHAGNIRNVLPRINAGSRGARPSGTLPRRPCEPPLFDICTRLSARLDLSFARYASTPFPFTRQPILGFCDGHSAMRFQ